VAAPTVGRTRYRSCGGPRGHGRPRATGASVAYYATANQTAASHSYAEKRAENNTAFQGAVYSVTDYHESNSAQMWGPVIARQLYISNNTHNHYVPFGTLLLGMPATYEEVTVLAPVSGSFGE
jgi:hypothetical protein